MKEEFQKWVDAGLWEGEDAFTKNFAVGNVSDWWLNKFQEIIKAIPPRCPTCEKQGVNIYGECVCSYECRDYVKKSDVIKLIK